MVHQICFILSFHLIYIFQTVALILIFSETSPLILSVVQSSVYVIPVFYQTFYIVFIVWYICCWLTKRYTFYNSSLKCMKLSKSTAKDRQIKLILMMELYKTLYKAVKYFNSFFGKFILHIFLSGFLYFLDSVHFMLYYGYLPWKIYLEIPLAAIYLVSVSRIYKTKTKSSLNKFRKNLINLIK